MAATRERREVREQRFDFSDDEYDQPPSGSGPTLKRKRNYTKRADVGSAGVKTPTEIIISSNDSNELHGNTVPGGSQVVGSPAALVSDPLSSVDRYFMKTVKAKGGGVETSKFITGTSDDWNTFRDKLYNYRGSDAGILRVQKSPPDNAQLHARLSLLKKVDKEERAAARKALKATGPKAVPKKRGPRIPKAVVSESEEGREARERREALLAQDALALTVIESRKEGLLQEGKLVEDDITKAVGDGSPARTSRHAEMKVLYDRAKNMRDALSVFVGVSELHFDMDKRLYDMRAKIAGMCTNSPMDGWAHEHVRLATYDTTRPSPVGFLTRPVVEVPRKVRQRGLTTDRSMLKGTAKVVTESVRKQKKAILISSEKYCATQQEAVIRAASARGTELTVSVGPLVLPSADSALPTDIENDVQALCIKLKAFREASGCSLNDTGSALSLFSHMGGGGEAIEHNLPRGVAALMYDIWRSVACSVDPRDAAAASAEPGKRKKYDLYNRGVLDAKKEAALARRKEISQTDPGVDDAHQGSGDTDSLEDGNE